MLLSLLQRWKWPSTQTKATGPGNRRKPLRCYPHFGGDTAASLAVKWTTHNIGNTVFAITAFCTHSPSPLHEVAHSSSSEDCIRFKNSLQAQKFGVVLVNQPNHDSLQWPRPEAFQRQNCEKLPKWTCFNILRSCAKIYCWEHKIPLWYISCLLP